MKKMLILVVLLTGQLFAKTITPPPKQLCGGWENWLQVVVTQEDQTKCAVTTSSVVTETCYHVWVKVNPGSEHQCVFQYDVPQSKVDNVVKKFMQEYMP